MSNSDSRHHGRKARHRSERRRGPQRQDRAELLQRLHEAESRLQSSESRQAFLQELNQRLRPLTDPEQIQYAAACALASYLQADRVGFAEDQGNDSTVTIVTSNMTYGVPGGAVSYPHDLYDPALLRFLRAGQTLVFPDIAHDSRIAEAQRSAYAAVQIAAMVNVPLLQDGHLLAVLFLHSRQSRVWTADELTLLEGVATRTWDAVERERAERAVQTGEQRFRLVTDAVPQLIWTNDRSGQANFFNQRWYSYSGLNYAASQGLGWQAIIHPEDAQVSIARWQQAFLSGNVFETEYRLRRADGLYRWHLGRNVPLKDESGYIIGWFGSATDIEDLKQAEAARRESDERFRLLVEGARDYAMFLLDVEGRVTFWNAGAERVFGWAESELLGQSAIILFTLDDQLSGSLQDELHTAYTAGRAEHRRWHRRKDGTRIFIDGIMIRLDDARGALRGFVKIGRDATRQRQAEEALQQSRAILEQRVIERTTELMHMSTMRQELLQRLVTVQDDERRRIAHDLHDGLGQILSALDIDLAAVQELAQLPSDMQATFQRIQRMLAHIDRDVNQLVMELHPAALDDLGLEEALQRYVTEWSAVSAISAEVLTIGFEHTRMPMASEATAYRIMQEALTNIRKHAHAQHVNVIAEQWPDRLSVVIEDDGVGFDLEIISQEAGAVRRFGLSAMHDRAHLVGGELTIESALDHGTTIYLTIPRSEDI